MSFDTLGLSDKVVEAVKAAGYAEPTPIQAQAIPHVLARRDVVGIAQTGTGKTASFVLPMLTLLEQGRARARMPRTLILEPTRELAAQVEENFARYGVNHKLTLALLIGGVSFDEQDKKITRGADVLIATPGRLLDHFERGRLLLTGVELLVIDEADRMLDMGFIPDIERIVKLLPPSRQTMLFSATMPGEIARLAAQFLRDPVRVEVSRPASTGENVVQTLVPSAPKPPDKRATLRRLLRQSDTLRNAIIFCNRKRDVATVARSLERHGFSAGGLHGDMDQYARMRTLDSFRDGTIKLLVASDVAARGLDIPDVSHIVNFDVPTHAEDYVHRIGRTARAGKTGEALTIVTPAERKYVASIEKLIGQPIGWAEAPPPVDEEPAPRRGRSRAEAADKDERPSRARRGRGRRGRPADGVVAEEAPVADRARRGAAPPPAEAPAAPGADAARLAKEPKPQKPGKKAAKAERAKAPGFEDHVPAFLLRPVRLPRDPEVLEDDDGQS